MADYEGGLDIRRDDGSVDQRIKLYAREGMGEVQLNVRNEGAAFGFALLELDLNAMEVYELAGALRAAADRASGTRWEPEEIARLEVERVTDEVDRANDPPPWKFEEEKTDA